MNIKEIAKLSGVSASTVSKILNNKDTAISQETRKKVLDVVKEYQYVPYSDVFHNGSKRRCLLGVVLREGSETTVKELTAIEGAAAENGYSILVTTVGQDEDFQKRQLQVMLGKKVSGIISLDVDWTGDQLEELENANVAALMCDSGMERKEECLQIVSMLDDSGYKAASYLVSKGHVKILCILEERQKQAGDRYQKVLFENKIPFYETDVIIRKKNSESSSFVEAGWYAKDYTAIICGSSEIAFAVYQNLQARGLNIPFDVSVICLEEFKCASLMNPELTSVKISRTEELRRSIQDLVKQIENQEYPRQKLKYILPELIERKSVDFPPVYGRGEKVVVVGSMNMDVLIYVPSIPDDNQTTIATGTALTPGGKGANQAVGAGKLGGNVYAIGRLGNDADGQEIYNNLINHRVKTDGVIMDSQVATGKAYIQVSGDGESNIVVYPGANKNLDREHIQRCRHLFEGAKYCLVSTEIPRETYEYVIRICSKLKVQVILKPSAMEKCDKKLLQNIAYFIPNKKELNLLVKEGTSIEEKAEILYGMGVKNVIITMGKGGCYLRNQEHKRFFSAADFVAVDTTGGADAFISALAVYLSEGVKLVRAIGYATYCAGISVTRPGVQPALPDRIALEMYQDDINSKFN